MRSPGLRLGVWLITLEAATFGAENALLPLRLSHLGASGLAIGLTFVLGSGLSASLSTVVGHVTDRRGPYLPLIAGLVIGAPLIALLVVPQTPLVLAALMIIAFGGPLTFSMIPAASMMTDSAEAVGVSLVLATTLFNLAYALGETLGAPISATAAQATSDFVPLLAIALLMLATAAWALTHRIRPAAQPEATSVARSTPSSSAAARQRHLHVSRGGVLGVAEHHVHREPVGQRRQPQRHLRGIRHRPLARFASIADDLLDRRAPALVEVALGRGRLRMVAGIDPQVDPQRPVAAGGMTHQQLDPLARGVDAVKLVQRLVERGVGAIDRFGEQRVLGAEVVDDGGRADPGPLRDVGEANLPQPSLADQLDGRLEDLGAPDVVQSPARPPAPAAGA